MGVSPSIIVQYPNIVPLQAIVGQGTAPQEGLTQGVAAGGAGALGGFNPLNWMQAGGPPTQGDGTQLDSANV